MIEVQIFEHGTPQYFKALALRDKILRQPLGLQFTPQELQKDEHDTHIGLFDNDEILACLTLTHTNTGIKMRQVAVKQSEQGKGLGKMLCRHAEDFATAKGYHTIHCNARKTAAPFYSSMGYKIVGAEFTEVGIPHYYMEKQLK